MNGRTRPVEQFFQFSLLGLLFSGFLALAGSAAVDLPTLVLTGAGLLLRLAIVLGWVRLNVHPAWTAAATLLYIGFYPLDALYFSREFIPATVHLICFLAVARGVTATTPRDYFFVKVIALLEVLAATLLSTSISFFVFLILFLIFGVATFACSEIMRSGGMGGRRVAAVPAFHGRLAALTTLLTLGIVMLTAGLFFILPRTARAAFRSMVSERYHLPGFSSEVTLGQIGQLKTQTTVVMHVRMKEPDERLSLKWRGAALSQFDGRRWYNPPEGAKTIRLLRGEPTPLADDDQRRRVGQRVNYQVRLGPIDTDTLFFAGIPEFVQIDDLRVLFRGPGEAYRTGMGSVEGRVYAAVAYRPEAGPSQFAGVKPLDPDFFNEHLLLPGSLDRRIIQLARETAKGSTPFDKARSMEQYLRTRFSYTTELLPEEVPDPMADFLFNRRMGHCEYFASALAVMLRAVHIPSRVVTGFQSGSYNPMTGWHVIRASDAHSWVEAWIPELGWTTFDPTPPDTNTSGPLGAAWARMMLYMDAAETVWRQWVVNYNLTQQVDLMARVQYRSRTMRPLEWMESARDNAARVAKTVLPALAGLMIVAVVIWFAGPRVWAFVRHRRDAARISAGRASPSDAALLYGRMLRQLKRHGLEKPAWLTPAEFARVVPPASASATLVAQITDAYHDLRYGHKLDAGPRMVRLIEELEGLS